MTVEQILAEARAEFERFFDGTGLTIESVDVDGYAPVAIRLRRADGVSFTISADASGGDAKLSIEAGEEQ